MWEVGPAEWPDEEWENGEDKRVRNVLARLKKSEEGYRPREHEDMGNA